jgi:hypothetical protein
MGEVALSRAMSLDRALAGPGGGIERVDDRVLDSAPCRYGLPTTPTGGVRCTAGRSRTDTRWRR